MKYANIIYNKRNGRLNLGDDMQILAIENLYNYMNIDYSQVVRIEVGELYAYDGEEIILPISFPLISYNDKLNVTCFSPKIHPVFLGLCILTSTLSSEDIDYLNRYAPIGCRDEHTLKTMQKYKIPAYLFGCMTMTFPLRETAVRGKIFCIDIPKSISELIPENLLDKCIFLSNVRYSNELSASPEIIAKATYQQYIREAEMVITSRMHVALPCIAAGIPVIFAKDIYSYRFVGIDRLIKIYSQDQYNLIDWNSKTINYEKHKRAMLELAKARINNKSSVEIMIKDFQKSWPCQSNHQYYIENTYDTEKYLKENWDQEQEYKYILWGVTQTAQLVKEFIDENYPYAQLIAVIDKSKEIMFDGILSKKKEQLTLPKETTVFVCADAAIMEATQWLREMGIKNYFFCCQNSHPI